MTAPGTRVTAMSGFRCVLDEQPGYLVPRRLLDADIASRSLLKLHVNPRCWFDGEAEMPVTFAGTDPDPSGMAGMVWIRDSVTSGRTPFWLGARYRALLAGARPGGAAPRDLAADVRAVLTCAGVLVDAEYETRRRNRWTEQVALAARRFVYGYAPLTGLVHPYLLGALRLYYRRMVRIGAFKLGDRRTERRFAAHNEPTASFLHHQLTDTVSAVSGQPVKPSYVYFAAYQSGAELASHVDRAQCEFSITFLVDCTPEPERESPWPLYLDTPHGTVTVFQCLGDGLLYKGRELSHYRKRLADGCTSTSIFFHYVPQDFKGPLR